MKGHTGRICAAFATLACLLLVIEASAIHNADVLVGKSRNKLKGDNIYGSLPKQTLKIRAARGAKAFLRVEHDLNESNATNEGLGKVKGRWNSRRLKVTVIRLTGGRKNVSAQIQGKGLRLPDFDVNNRVDFLVKIRPNRGTATPRGITSNMDIWALLWAGTSKSRDKVRVEFLALQQG